MSETGYILTEKYLPAKEKILVGPVGWREGAG